MFVEEANFRTLSSICLKYINGRNKRKIYKEWIKLGELMIILHL